MESVQFDLAGEENGHYFFHARQAQRETVGATNYLIPPFEHHIMRNVSEQVAITLHIYGGEMSACNVFLPAARGGYTRQTRLLSYTE